MTATTPLGGDFKLTRELIFKTLTPLGHKILLELYESPQKKHGLIHLPDSFKTNTDLSREAFGKIVTMGSLAYSDNEAFPEGPIVKIGDYVSFLWHHASKIEFRLSDGTKLTTVEIYDEQVCLRISDMRIIENV